MLAHYPIIASSVFIVLLHLIIATIRYFFTDITPSLLGEYYD